MARELGADEQVIPSTPATAGIVRSLRADEKITPVAPKPGIAESLLTGLNNLVAQFNAGTLDTIGQGDLLGAPAPANLSQGASRAMGNAAGQTVAVLAPAVRMVPGVSTVAPSLTRPAPMLRNFVQDVAKTAMTRPGAFWTLEMVPAAAGGAAGQATLQATDSPMAAFAAELLAGATTSMGAPAVGTALRLSPMVNLAKQTIDTFRSPTLRTPRGDNRAVTRLAGAEPDAAGALRRANEANVLEGAPLTLAELAESPGLLSLQRSIAESSDRLSQAAQERFADVNALSQEAVRAASGSPGKVSIEDTRRYLSALLEERIRIARVATDEAIAKLAPSRTNADVNALARVELDNAYEAALKQEKDLWEALDLEVPAAYSNLDSTYQRIVNESASDRVALLRDLVPGKLRSFLGSTDAEGKFVPGAFGEEPPTARELVSFRQELLDMAQRERAKDAPNRRKIRAATMLQEAILNDIAQLGGTSDAFDVARAFSRDMNQRFRQGEVGTIMGFDIDGSGAVDPMLTLESTLGLGNARGANATSQLLEAVQRTGNTPAMRGHMENFLRDEFTKHAVRYGMFDPKKAANYVMRRRDTLRLFPELRRDMEAAVSSGDAQKVAENMLEKPSVSAAALVLGSSPLTTIDTLFASSNPQQRAKELRRMFDADLNGSALAGMQNSMADWLLGKSMSGAADVRDLQFLSGRKMREQLTNPAIRAAFEEMFTPQQMEKLDQAANTMAAIDLSRTAQPAMEGVISDKEALFFRIVRSLSANVVGGNIARAVGQGQSIAIPARTVQVFDEMKKRGLDPARELLIEAFTSNNTQLLRALMMRTPKLDPAQERFVHRQLNAWAGVAAQQYGLSFLPEQPDTRAPSSRSQRPPGSSFIPSDLPRTRSTP